MHSGKSNLVEVKLGISFAFGVDCPLNVPLDLKVEHHAGIGAAQAFNSVHLFEEVR